MALQGALVMTLLSASVTLTACGSDSIAPSDAGLDHMGSTNPDGKAPGADAAVRLLPHDNVVLSAMALGVVYIGAADAGGAPSEDTILNWLLGSPYWLYLDEYGIGNGSIAGSIRIPISSLLQPADIDVNGLVDALVLSARVAEAIHSGAADSSASAINIPGAQAYAIYLPDGVNVALGHRGSYTYQTCIDANGYHGYDGFEPYAILPPCDEGRSLYAAAHELAEVATDPQPYKGWASDTDIPMNGGEIADLCAAKVMQEGVIVTQLWSNQVNGCIPIPSP